MMVSTTSVINFFVCKFRREKVDALKKEIEILAQNHECEVDRKDSIIQMLTRDLDECEEQYGFFSVLGFFLCILIIAACIDFKQLKGLTWTSCKNLLIYSREKWQA